MQLPGFLAKRTASKKPGKNPPPANNQKAMMYGLWGFIMFISISWPTAMSLYWLVSAAAQVAQTLFIQWKYIENPKGV